MRHGDRPPLPLGAGAEAPLDRADADEPVVHFLLPQDLDGAVHGGALGESVEIETAPRRERGAPRRRIEGQPVAGREAHRLLHLLGRGGILDRGVEAPQRVEVTPERAVRAFGPDAEAAGAGEHREEPGIDRPRTLAGGGVEGREGAGGQALDLGDLGERLLERSAGVFRRQAADLDLRGLAEGLHRLANGSGGGGGTTGGAWAPTSRASSRGSMEG